MAQAPEKLDMLKFVDQGQSYPSKRAPELRAEDFQVIAAKYARNAAAEPSARIPQCRVP